MHAQSLAALEENERAGLTEPASLHPVIDAGRCMGCGSCASACPEGNVLGLVAGKAALINATHCIGHGACKEACPFDAITLVFGTEKRGVDIPAVKPNFETNMPGIFIAGELGGMGLIRNAVEQGRQAIQSIAAYDGAVKDNQWQDVVIVGAGPAGFSASLGAMELGLRAVTIEQESLGGTVSHFPRGKLVMTAPVKLPLVGKVSFTETTKETLMAFWEKTEQETGVNINYGERLEEITPEAGGYLVRTSKASYRTRTVLLAIGRRGTPRKLGVEGESLSKVVYRLIDAEQYRGQHVLVVGGGDSALEAAVSVAEQPGTTVALSYRSGAFSRARDKNRKRIDEAVANGRLQVIFNSNVLSISESSVTIDQEGKTVELPNDAIIVSAGGILPTPFLQKTGIEVETHHGKT
ncbi:NAD(P)-binding domain-containing protein [Thiogranum longum]|uniref:NAD(P)-binding domain-containing protein n=1 Tax=Thiogranum longum TaxID=1537524 RepID=UPI001A9DCCD3|nr:NAD(P)-binding domain-containing protein [Thiogranum longum]